MLTRLQEPDGHFGKSDFSCYLPGANAGLSSSAVLAVLIRFVLPIGGVAPDFNPVGRSPKRLLPIDCLFFVGNEIE
jgi:hypothetical protein